MVSERLIVESRWAILMVVLLPFSRAARALLTRVSDSASRAEVAVPCVLVRRPKQEEGKERRMSYLRQG